MILALLQLAGHWCKRIITKGTNRLVSITVV